MTRNRNQVAVRHELRPGEGAVLRAIHTPSDGGVNAQFSLMDAPVPERKYAADAVTILDGSEEFRVVFGQRETIGDGLYSMIVVHMSRDALNNLSEGLSEVLGPLGKYLQTNSISVGQLFEIKRDAPQTVHFSANIVALGYASREGTMDFYSASSFALDRVRKQGRELQIDPIVRVSLPSRYMVALLQRIAAIVGVKEAGEKTS